MRGGTKGVDANKSLEQTKTFRFGSAAQTNTFFGKPYPVYFIVRWLSQSQLENEARNLIECLGTNWGKLEATVSA
jgi:hypothetical protein